jgi:tubulin polyglutamylase TTLL6/13
MARPRQTTQKSKAKGTISVNLTFTEQDVVHRTCEELGYSETASYTECVLFWYGNAKSAAIATTLLPWQFANHFGASFQICDKVGLARKFEEMRTRFPSIYDFHPQNFIFPEEVPAFRTYMRNQTDSPTFIIKPDKGGSGRRIKLVQSFEGLSNYKDSAVCQEYIAPFLLNRLKFDLRIYVLVTSVDPLRVYIHKENMARFCTEKYVAPAKSNLTKMYSHLTNYSVNKDNPKFVQNTEGREGSAHKRGTTSVFAEMESQGVDVERLQDQIDEVIQFTLLAVQQEYIQMYRRTVKTQDERSRLFEILGFDVMIDEDLKPWLIEVNNNPSLHAESPFDEALKVSVAKGTLQIIDLQPSFRQKVMQRLQRKSSVSLFDGREESERSLATN